MEIRIVGLKKNYGRKQALNGVTLTLTEGIHGLLGPNGAGKTTMMNILTGNLYQSSGEVYLDGAPISKLGSVYRSHLGYMPQQQVFYPTFTSEQFLFYIGALRGMKKQEAIRRIDWAMKLLWLEDVRRIQIRKLSGGTRQRLLLAQAILADPDILILDEPTAGMDPMQRIIVRNLIAEISLHKIVLISTHVVSDVEYVSKDIVLLSNGSVLSQGTPSKLQAELSSSVWEIIVPEAQVSELSNYGNVCAMAKGDEGIYVRMLAKSKPPFQGSLAHPTMEDVYLSYFGASVDLCDMN